jgi:hypothetical protein
MLSPKLRRLDDHVIARQRRMYARLLFVVVGIFGLFSSDFGGFGPLLRSSRRLGTERGGGYTLRA